MPYTTAYLTLASLQVDRLVDFYAALLQQDPVSWVPSRYGEFHLEGLRLVLFKPRADQVGEFQSRRPGQCSLCCEVSDLEQAIAHLDQLGYPPPGPILEAPHGAEVYAYDPDGNRLILYQPARSRQSPRGD
ncbi:MAG TPA: glyoxalase [Leptolyngbyaceae cyanobacterium M65_K2018_010]|nr:glyoxalase [Leptolyngbyaceae cyanobacterium M65_K2018_010]